MPYKIIRDDITNFSGDAIVCPTDRFYTALGGADAAIHNAAGPELDRACAALESLECGTAAITSGFALSCRYVIHTVGPVWRGGDFDEEKYLRLSYRNCLALAKQNDVETIAFPLISSGTFGFPKDQVMRIALDEVTTFLLQNEMMVYIVVFDRDAYEVGRQITADIDELINDAQAELVIQGEKDKLFSSTRLREAIRKSNHDSMPRAVEEFSIQEVEGADCSPMVLAASMAMPMPSTAVNKKSKLSVEEFMEYSEQSFRDRLITLTEERGLKDSDVYKRANISRQVYNKILNVPSYLPKKETAVSICVALRLNVEQTNDLLKRLGYVLNRNYTFDLIIRYFMEKGIYDQMLINETLAKYDQPLLGSGWEKTPVAV